MFKKLIYLQWKSFFRAAGVATKLAQKILIGFVLAYFAFVLSGLAFIVFLSIILMISFAVRAISDKKTH